MKNFVLVLDAYGLIYRTYYAFYNNPLMTNDGKNISCVYGFFNTLYQLIEKFHPDTVIAALDSIGPTFRHEQYPAYKANREKTPDDLHEQIPLIEEVLHALQVQSLRCNGFEADDIIASIVKKNNPQKNDLYIFSSDKDLLQLVNDSVHIIKSDKSNKLKVCGMPDIESEWGVPAEKILDLLSFTGDTADNVKGIDGIGIKTAQKILSRYTSADELFANLDNDTNLTPRIKQKLHDGKENFLQARSLIKLNNEVPVDFIFDKTNFDFVSAAKKLSEYKIPSLAKKYEALSGKKILQTAGEVKSLNEKAAAAEQKTEEKKQPDAAASKLQIKKILTPLQKCASEENNFTLTAPHIFISDAAEFKNIFAEHSAAPNLSLYVQTVNDTCKEIAYLCFCFDEKTVYILNCLERNTTSGEADNLFSSQKNSYEEIKSIFKNFLSGGNRTLIMHDAKTTLKLLKKDSFIEDFNIRVFDTSIAAWVLQSTLNNYSLETISKSVFNLSILEYKEIIKRKKTFFEIEKELQEKYLVQNTVLSLQFYRILYAALQSENNLKKIYYDIELQLLPVLCRMEAAGIFLSVEELQKFSQRISNEISINEAAVYQSAGYEFNIASPKQLQTVLFDEKKLKPFKKIKTGFSTDDATLETLLNDDPIIVPIMNYRKLTKLKTTYADALPQLCDANGYIHTNFLQTGTATGRLSSKDPNLQNIPIRDELGRKIRHAFYAPEGEVLISADYSQIELVVLAHLSEDAALCDAFTHGLDVHAKTASIIFGVPLDAVQPDTRRIAKTINFGVIYGMSAFRLSNELKIPRKSAASFIESYFENYAAVRKFLDGIKNFAEKNGYVETISGRRRYIPEINNRNKVVKSAAERIAINTPIQGSASDIVKLAMIQLDAAIRKEKLPATLLLQVHDEIILRCKKSEAEHLMALTKDIMEHVFTLRVPLRVSIESGLSWGDFH